MYKKITMVVMAVLTILFLCHFVAYASNEDFIKKYKNGEEASNSLTILGFMQPYIANYNQGNVYYKQGNYELAIMQYDKALNNNPPHKHYNQVKYNRECQIRINKVLAMIAPIDKEKIMPEDVDGIIKLLESAKEVLSEEGCATSKDSGHDDESIILYKEICEFEDKLKNISEPQEDDDKKNEDKDQEKETQEESSEPESEIKDERIEKLIETQGEGQKEREKNLEDIRNLFDYDFYYGPEW